MWPCFAYHLLGILFAIFLDFVNHGAHLLIAYCAIIPIEAGLYVDYFEHVPHNIPQGIN